MCGATGQPMRQGRHRSVGPAVKYASVGRGLLRGAPKVSDGLEQIINVIPVVESTDDLKNVIDVRIAITVCIA